MSLVMEDQAPTHCLSVMRQTRIRDAPEGEKKEDSPVVVPDLEGTSPKEAEPQPRAHSSGSRSRALGRRASQRSGPEARSGRGPSRPQTTSCARRQKRLVDQPDRHEVRENTSRRVHDGVARKTTSRRRKPKKPQRLVKIARPFYLGVYEVTQKQYPRDHGRDRQFMTIFGDDLPADPAIHGPWWREAVRFCNLLSEREGLRPYYRLGPSPEAGGDGYRLPTDAGVGVRLPGGEQDPVPRFGDKPATPWRVRLVQGQRSGPSSTRSAS